MQPLEETCKYSCKCSRQIIWPENLLLREGWCRQQMHQAHAVTLSKIRILFPRRLTSCMARRSGAFGSPPMNILHAAATAGGNAPLGKDDNFAGLSTREKARALGRCYRSQPTDMRPTWEMRTSHNHNSLTTGVNMGSSGLRLAVTSSTSCIMRRVIC